MSQSAAAAAAAVVVVVVVVVMVVVVVACCLLLVLCCFARQWSPAKRVSSKACRCKRGPGGGRVKVEDVSMWLGREHISTELLFKTVFVQHTVKG